MRIPVSWLREYVDLGEASTDDLVETIDAAFVRVGLEVEAVHRLGESLTGPIVLGRVQGVTDLVDFKKPIRYCTVDVGLYNVDGEPRGIICGATNFGVGDVVIVALPGAVLPGGFKITARKTYGHVSDGMICSARELGLGDDHTGILTLSQSDIPGGAGPGGDAIGLLGLDDVVFELAITPDRGYCLSVRGLARELGHGLGVAFHDPGAIPTLSASDETPYSVRVEDPVGCDRFVALVVRGIDPAAPTPLWMRRRLLLAGMRSISLTVDITNYVMLEVGQPMHAFDLSRLSGPIVVRRGRSGERIRTLDGVDRLVDPEDLLITDDTGPIGLAAVMGGATTEVSAGTTDVLLECAHWDPMSVTRTARRHRLPSEASKRFERGVDPQMAPVAAEKAVRLLVELAGGIDDGHVLDLDARKSVPAIVFDPSLPSRIAGVPYGRTTVVSRLTDVGCAVAVSDADGLLTVTPPSWRGDLVDPIDLVEEVVRLEGYDAIPAMLPPATASPGLTPEQRQHRSISRSLAEAGYIEVLNYPFVSSAVHDHFGLETDDLRRVAVRLANPLSDEEPQLRTSLLPGLLKTLQRNLGRGQRDLSLFETGLVYHPDPGAPTAPSLGVDRRPTEEELTILLASVPRQPRHVAAVLSGERDPSGWWGSGRLASWADAVEAARMVADAVRVSFDIRQATKAPWHPGRCAAIFIDGSSGPHLLGHAGELHPRVLADLDLPPGVCAIELDLSALPQQRQVFAPVISPFPPTLLDVALVVAEEIPAADVQKALVAGAGDLLEALRLFDVYTGAQLGEGRKSLAFNLTFRAPDRTLTVVEATAARDAAVAEAARRTGAVLRT